LGRIGESGWDTVLGGGFAMSVEHLDELRAPRQRRPSDGPERPHRYAFVIHPLHLGQVLSHPALRWARVLPNEFVERLAALLPPFQLSHITGGRSPATGQRIEGILLSLGSTPRQMLTRPPRFTYDRLVRAARRAERGGARILGLGAYTKVVGDAGLTVAREAALPVTSGNSLTVAATLETAKVAARRMGLHDLTSGRAMIVGATGSIGSVCSRLVARAIRRVVLVSIEPERLAALKAKIESETPGAEVVTALESRTHLPDCDLVITATSAFGQRVLELAHCKPGAVVLDVALPTDISAEEAAVRPDVLVVESGEVVIPGPIDLGYDVGLPRGVAYACLAEAALLAMDGTFECYTLGRDIEVERVKNIFRLFRKHGLRIAELRSFGRELSEEDFVERRALAARLRRDPALFAQTCAEAARRLEAIPPRSKGLSSQVARQSGLRERKNSRAARRAGPA